MFVATGPTTAGGFTLAGGSKLAGGSTAVLSSAGLTVCSIKISFSFGASAVTCCWAVAGWRILFVQMPSSMVPSGLHKCKYRLLGESALAVLEAVSKLADVLRPLHQLFPRPVQRPVEPASPEDLACRLRQSAFPIVPSQRKLPFIHALVGTDETAASRLFPSEEVADISIAIVEEQDAFVVFIVARFIPLG